MAEVKREELGPSSAPPSAGMANNKHHSFSELWYVQQLLFQLLPPSQRTRFPFFPPAKIRRTADINLSNKYMTVPLALQF